jgi:hypothetical protein
MYAFRTNSTGKERPMASRATRAACTWLWPVLLRAHYDRHSGPQTRQGAGKRSRASSAGTTMDFVSAPADTQAYYKYKLTDINHSNSKHINQGLANYVDRAWCSAFGGRRKRRPTIRLQVPSECQGTLAQPTALYLFNCIKLTLLMRDENTANYQQRTRRGHELLPSLSHVTNVLLLARSCLHCASSMWEAHALPSGTGHGTQILTSQPRHR